MTRTFLTFCLLLQALTVSAARADTAASKTTAALPASLISPALPPPVRPLPKVVLISTVHTTAAQKTGIKDDVKAADAAMAVPPQIAYPGNIIRFTISHPREFLQIRPRDRSKVVVYINGVELKGIAANWYSSVTNEQINNGNIPAFKNDTAGIDIVLLRNDSTRAAWNFFYGNTARFFDNYVDVDASVGWEGMSALEKDVNHAANIRVVYYKFYQFVIWLVFFVAVVLGFGFLAVKTNAIKEGDSDGAYSLSLTQLLFWTTLAIGAFIYTLVLTDLTSSFNSSILYMIGISLATTGAASAIDTQFRNNNAGNVKKPHSKFYRDVLTSDGKSFSVQRIQIFAWNLVLGLYFIIYTVNNKSMPVFSDTMLLLAGFSSLSYLGGKPPENTAIKKNQEEGSEK